MRVTVLARVADRVNETSEARLTGEVYTDTSALPLFGELRKLAPAEPSLIASQKSSETRRNSAQYDQKPLAGLFPQGAVESVLAQSCPNKNWRREPESNRR